MLIHIIKKERFIYFVIHKQNTLPLFHCHEIKSGRREKKREMEITNSPSHTDEQVYKKRTVFLQQMSAIRLHITAPPTDHHQTLWNNDSMKAH